jgi:hypothetical protein
LWGFLFGELECVNLLDSIDLGDINAILQNIVDVSKATITG